MSAGVATSGVTRPHSLNVAPAQLQTSSSSHFYSLSPTRIHQHQHALKHQSEEDMHHSSIDNDLSAACAHSLHMSDRPDAGSVNSSHVAHAATTTTASRTSSHLTQQHTPMQTYQLNSQHPIVLQPQQPLPVSSVQSYVFTPSFASQSYVSVSSTHPSPAFWSASSQVTSPAARFESPDATPLQATSAHAGQLPPPLDCSRLGDLDSELDPEEKELMGPTEQETRQQQFNSRATGQSNRNNTFQPSGAHSLTASPATQASLSVLSLKFGKSSDSDETAAASSPAPYRPSKARRLSLPSVPHDRSAGSHVSSTVIAQSESRFNSFPLIQRSSSLSSHAMDDEEVANSFHSRTPSLTSSSSFSSSASSLALDNSAPLTPASVGVKLRVRSIRNNQSSALSDHSDFNFNFNSTIRSTPVRSGRATLPSLSTASMIQRSFEEDRSKRLSPLPPSLAGASASRAKRKHGLDPNEPFEPLGNNMANSLDVTFATDLLMPPEPFVPQLPFQNNISTPFISPSVSPAIAPLASCLNPPTAASTRRIFHKYRSAGSVTTSPCISAVSTPLVSPALVSAKTDASESHFWRQTQ